MNSFWFASPYSSDERRVHMISQACPNFKKWKAYHNFSVRSSVPHLHQSYFFSGRFHSWKPTFGCAIKRGLMKNNSLHASARSCFLESKQNFVKVSVHAHILLLHGFVQSNAKI